jgi:hypothetical protein
MLLWILLGLVNIGKAEEASYEPQEYMVIEAHREFEVYVAPAKIKNEAPEIEAVIGDYSVFGYISTYSKLAKIKNDSGVYEPMNINYEYFKVYNEDTIKYSWDNCDYLEDAKECSFHNNHYLIETYITVDKHQLVIEMFLYDPEMQIISRGSQTSNLKITWIKQQEITTNVNESGIMPQQQISGATSCNSKTKSCDTSGGITRNSGNYRREVTTSKPKEELPLRWDIPHKLLDSHIQQTAQKMWLSTRLTNE